MTKEEIYQVLVARPDILDLFQSLMSIPEDRMEKAMKAVGIMCELLQKTE